MQICPRSDFSPRYVWHGSPGWRRGKTNGRHEGWTYSSACFSDADPVSARITSTHRRAERTPGLHHSRWAAIAGDEQDSACWDQCFFSRKTSWIRQRRKVDLLGLVRGLMGPLGSLIISHSADPFRWGLNKVWNYLWAYLLIHQGCVCEWTLEMRYFKLGTFRVVYLLCSYYQSD